MIDKLRKEKIISWKITPEMHLSRIKIARRIIFLPYFSMIFGIFGKLYVDLACKEWAFIVLALLIVFYVYIFYFYKQKKDIEYIIDEKGLTTRKGNKEVIYNWEDFKQYYNNKEAILNSRNKVSSKFNKTLESDVIAPIFTLLMKNQFKKWGQVSIATNNENYKEIQRILSSKLDKLNKMKSTLSIWLLSITIIFVIAIIVIWFIFQG
jgi:Ca2+/Na+ antiporter